VPLDSSASPPRVAQVARQSKEAISGARSVVSQVSLLGERVAVRPVCWETGRQDEEGREARTDPVLVKTGDVA